jgi:ribonucleoside-diphosphate reductase alpha chain
VKQLKGISGPNPTWEDGRLILSTPDAIGKALDDHLKNRTPQKSKDEPKFTHFTIANEAETHGKSIQDYTVKNISSCPDCGSPVQFQSGCVTCMSCGFSKCD